MSSKHQNINFTVEQGNIGSLLLLGLQICRKSGKFVTSVYRKPTFSGVFTNYKSFIPTSQKRGLVYKYKCGGCDATYYGKAKRHFQIRICEHLGISHLTGKNVKIDNNKANDDPRTPLMLQLVSIL